MEQRAPREKEGQGQEKQERPEKVEGKAESKLTQRLNVL